MEIVLKAIRDLVSQIKLAVAESTNISLTELERRLDGSDARLVIAPAARKYADQLRVLWAWMTEDDRGCSEYWMARAWIRRFALTSVYANDPITDEDIVLVRLIKFSHMFTSNAAIWAELSLLCYHVF